MRNVLLPAAGLLVALSLGLPSTAHALYLDPGTGSIIVQAVIAGVVGVAAVTKLYWQRIRNLLTGTREPPRADG